MSTPKRHASGMEDDDTRQVVMKKRRDSSSSPQPSQLPPPQLPPPSQETTHSSSSSSPGKPDYESPPAAVPIPWERDDDDDDDESASPSPTGSETQLQFSPASPPLIQTTEREERSPATLYVLPDASFVLPADGAACIPDRPANPEPSTSLRDISEMDPQVCDLLIEEGIANRIAYNSHRSHLSLDEVTSTICQDIAATILSPEWQQQLKEQIIATNPGL